MTEDVQHVLYSDDLAAFAVLGPVDDTESALVLLAKELVLFVQVDPLVRFIQRFHVKYQNY